MNTEQEIRYWKFFNKFVRLIGFIFIVGGIAFGVWGWTSIINPKALKDAMPPGDVLNEIIYFVSPFLTLTGFLMMKLEPYYPIQIKNRMNSSHNEEDAPDPNPVR